MKNWVQLTKEQAMHHKLYGCGGWLILFYILFALNLLSGIGHSAIVVQEFYGGAEQMAGKSAYAIVTSDSKVLGLQLLGWVQFALYLSVLYLALSKNHRFRRLSTVFFVAFVFLKPMVLAATGNFMELVAFPFYALFIGLALLYINLSKRVRVTYDWTVKPTDTMLKNVDSASSAPKAKKSSLYDERKEPC